VRLRELSLNEIQGFIKSTGLVLRVGGYAFRIKANELCNIDNGLSILYADYEVEDSYVYSDFDVSIRVMSEFFFIKKACFLFDDFSPFSPLPYQHAPALLEWGMNWCISTHINTHLIVHAAVVEKSGYAAVLPAPPGSGKSTLTAALIQEGWRLLSDELTCIDIQTANVSPIPRPVSLKNQSIDIIQKRYADAQFGPLSTDTGKGSVSHMKPPTSSVLRQAECCPVRWIIFPKYECGAVSKLVIKSKAQSFIDVADNSFNYSRLGTIGFNVLSRVMDRADCFRFEYSQLDEAVDIFNNLNPDLS
jgi:HprK-related kinase A